MTRRISIGAVLVIVGAAAVWWLRGAQAPQIASGDLRGYNVLLVTIDTLRADRVGAYGSKRGLTGTIDRLASEGWLFPVAYAHVPLTLPSHTTLMTGAYPFANGVRDNGSFRLDDSKPTLATTLKAAGYRSGAFVGAFVLDARFGLNRGFDVYDDRMLSTGTSLEVVQRTAEQVLEPAEHWIAERPSQIANSPFFAWVHLYDPHEPYTPPAGHRSGYDGEIEYADASLGRFLDRLKAAGALDRTLVVVTSDHGESLGEHGERTHGLFAYDATLRVPLVIWTSTTRPAVVPAPARLVDVMPTILDLVGVTPPAPIDGRSLRPFITGERQFDDAPSYFEALNANLTRDWAPLRGLVASGMKLIDLPIPELYDLSADPGEANNIYLSRPERARSLETRLDRLGASTATPSPSAVDPEAQARLRSLGYIVASSSKPKRKYAAGDDPKRLVRLNQSLDDAAAAWSKGDRDSAIRLLQGVVSERPDFTIAYDRLALILRDSGRIEEAVKTLDEAARAGHADASLLRSLGSLLRDTGQLPRSASVLEALVRDNATDLEALDALAQTYTRMKRMREAEALFRRVLAASPNAATTWNNLGVLYLTESNDRAAIDALSKAIAINPALAGAHNGLGVAYARTGDVPRAVEEWKEAVRLRPSLNDARANLERVGAR